MRCSCAKTSPKDTSPEEEGVDADGVDQDGAEWEEWIEMNIYDRQNEVRGKIYSDMLKKR